MTRSKSQSKEITDSFVARVKTYMQRKEGNALVVNKTQQKFAKSHSRVSVLNSNGIRGVKFSSFGF